MAKVRTRFAPSPTGYMHIGNLRTALYTYLIAKHQGGDFILRIEDTDRDRYMPESIAIIYETLAITGIQHDEGPDVGGPYGPYVQSERKEIYGKHAHLLIDKGEAYPCFCSIETLRTAREEYAGEGFWKYPGTCRDIPPEVARERMKHEEYVVRQKMPQTGETFFDDIVFGRITVPNSELEDQILLKADGLPTYNFANVVDDHLMAITHVVRGTEYLSSAPKYNLLYEAFGWEIPEYIHLTPIMREPGKKLSKRDGDASFQDYYEKGYLQEAIINYIALLGWSPRSEEEIFSLEDLVRTFDIQGLSKAPSVFDPEKLRWMNGVYIRKMSKEEFIAVAEPYWEDTLRGVALDKEAVAELLQPRVEVLEEMPGILDFIRQLPDYPLTLLEHEKTGTDLSVAKNNLERVLPALAALENWDKDSISACLKAIQTELGVKTASVLWPVRIAVSGLEATPGGVYDVLLLAGKDLTLERIKIAIDRISAHI